MNHSITDRAHELKLAGIAPEPEPETPPFDITQNIFFRLNV